MTKLAKTERSVWLQRGALVAIVIFLGVFGMRTLQRGVKVDRCADELVDRAQQKDREFVTRAVQSPLINEQILAAYSVELVFVRPVTEDWTRVGLALRKTETATRAELVQLVVDTRGTTCTFLRDYEAGAFGSP